MTGAIVVNGRFEGRRITGVDRYSTEIVKRLGNRVKMIKPYRTQSGVSGHLWEQLILPASISSEDLLWSPANSGPLAVSRQVLTIHDISPLEHPEWFVPAYALLYQLLLPLLSHRVKCVLTPSVYVRQKVISRFSLPADRVVAISEGVDLEKFRPLDPGLIHERYSLPDKYVLFIGSLQPRKNLISLLDAWKLLEKGNPDISLVIVGTEGRIFRQVDLPSQMVRVIYLGYVPEEDLSALYAGATIFILPSLDEGFGLTVLEAMACGTPVVISKAGALPEVAGNAALQVDPASVNDIAEGLRTLLSVEKLRLELKQKGLERAREFPWERTVEGIWGVLSRNV
jgi:glycosyltransferase involved in cell wall biosynthesis